MFYRGAELINERLINQIEMRKKGEEEILKGIKRKMERIKERQHRLQEKSALFESEDHYQGNNFELCDIYGKLW